MAKFSQRNFRHIIYNQNNLWYITRHGAKNPFIIVGYQGPSYLRDRDILYKSDSGYIVYERLFGEWLKRYTASDSAALRE